ncbi:MAG: SDR family NAD(P)-dependent oxidoreductase [Acidimicrobiales bacterium]|nr:SDR family NAD(P)-dependent oxidoreductase [Acidimicrobiales bacterium]
MLSLRQIADTALEATVVGSFTKIGSRARGALFDHAPVHVDLSGQRAVVTGSSSGIGRAAAAGLMALGAEVVVTSRSPERAAAAAADLNDAGHAGHASSLAVDTGDFESVEAAVAALGEGPPISMLCHNAGALTDRYETNSAGIEQTLASHLIGPYLLTTRLRPRLTDGARVVWMSSGGMYTQKFDLERLEMSERNYNGSVAYARAKRAQVELVAHLGPKWAPDVVMHSMHPGWVDTPGVAASLPGFKKVTGPLLRNAEEGADTMIWLAATGGDHQPGTFWLDRRPRSTQYVPGTGGSDKQREALVGWLDTFA